MLPKMYLVPTAWLRLTCCATLKTTPQAVPYIQEGNDKMAVWRSAVPVPPVLSDGLKSFLNVSKVIAYEERPARRGVSVSLRTEKDRYTRATKFEAKGQTFHGFRKALNTYLMPEKVPFEVRCQLICHEFDHVNKQVFAEQFSTEEVAGFWFQSSVSCSNL